METVSRVLLVVVVLTILLVRITMLGVYSLREIVYSYVCQPLKRNKHVR